MDWVLTSINGNSEALTAADVEARMAPSFLEVVRAQEVVELLQSLDQGPGLVRANRFDGRRTDTTLSVVLTTSQMHQGRISVRTESDPPHRIESILITPLR
jgi:hypothetical protein